VRVREPAGAAALTGWAWRLYMANWRPVLAVSALAAAVRWLLDVTTAQPATLPFAPGPVAVPAPWAVVVGAAVALWSAATILVFFGGTPEGEQGPGGAMAACARIGLRRIWPLFVAGLVMGVVGAAGLILLVIPGVYILTRWAVAPVIAVVDGGPAAGALGRSAQLTAPHFWHVLGTMVVGFLAGSVVPGVIATAGDAILSFVGLSAPAGIALWSDLVAAAAAPWTLALMVALCDDLMLRAEQT
jgi:hypothetical protein